MKSVNIIWNESFFFNNQITHKNVSHRQPYSTAYQEFPSFYLKCAWAVSAASSNLRFTERLLLDIPRLHQLCSDARKKKQTGTWFHAIHFSIFLLCGALKYDRCLTLIVIQWFIIELNLPLSHSPLAYRTINAFRHGAMGLRLSKVIKNDIINWRAKNDLNLILGCRLWRHYAAKAFMRFILKRLYNLFWKIEEVGGGEGN